MHERAWSAGFQEPLDFWDAEEYNSLTPPFSTDACAEDFKSRIGVMAHDHVFFAHMRNARRAIWIYLSRLFTT